MSNNIQILSVFPTHQTEFQCHKCQTIIATAPLVSKKSGSKHVYYHVDCALKVGLVLDAMDDNRSSITGEIQHDF